MGEDFGTCEIPREDIFGDEAAAIMRKTLRERGPNPCYFCKNLTPNFHRPPASESYRPSFNSYDKRLQRIMEATILVMEAFYGHENKIKYDIIGHSGETYNLEFVSAENPPKNNKERLDVIKKMYAHSQFCLSGDHTLPATVNAIDTILKEDCDEAIVVVLSDANLDHYNISPKRFGQILTSSLDVNSFAIFIGSLGDQAARLTQNLPPGRAFVCLDLSQIPQILQEIFNYSLLYKS